MNQFRHQTTPIYIYILSYDLNLKQGREHYDVDIQVQ